MHNDHKVFSPKNMSKLEHPDRYKEIPPLQVLEQLELEEGHIFGDFGCGIGFFSIPAAQLVSPAGHVYASDISDEMLQGLLDRLPKENTEQVTTCRAGMLGKDGQNSEITSLGIAKNILDRAMISMVLHEVDDPVDFLKQAAMSIKVNGKLAVIEWIKAEMPQGPKMDIRISEKELDSMLEQAGFTTERFVQLSQRFYLTIASKK